MFKWVPGPDGSFLHLQQAQGPLQTGSERRGRELSSAQPLGRMPSLHLRLPHLAIKCQRSPVHGGERVHISQWGKKKGDGVKSCEMTFFFSSRFVISPAWRKIAFCKSWSNRTKHPFLSSWGDSHSHRHNEGIVSCDFYKVGGKAIYNLGRYDLSGMHTVRLRQRETSINL